MFFLLNGIINLLGQDTYSTDTGRLSPLRREGVIVQSFTVGYATVIPFWNRSNVSHFSNDPFYRSEPDKVVFDKRTIYHICLKGYGSSNTSGKRLNTHT